MSMYSFILYHKLLINRHIVFSYDKINTFDTTGTDVIYDEKIHYRVDIEDIPENAKNIIFTKLYNTYSYLANILKRKCKIKINIMSARLSSDNIARELIFEALKTVKFDSIGDREALFLTNSTMGAFTYYESKPFSGEYSVFDINWMFSDILANSSFKFPYRRGIYRKLKQIKEIDLSLNGIYQLEILELEDDDEKFNFMFKYNESGFYTNYDIEIMNKLGILYELNQEVGYNSLIYEKHKSIYTKDYFNFINEVFIGLKENPELKPTIKPVINKMWGIMSQTAQSTISINELTDTHKIKSIDINTNKAVVYDAKYKYRYNTARIKPFILSYSRLRLFNIIWKLRSFKIVRVHTDSITVNITDPSIFERYTKTLVNDDIGNFKIEKSLIFDNQFYKYLNKLI